MRPSSSRDASGPTSPGAVFASDRILIKHGSDYEPPEGRHGQGQGVVTAHSPVKAALGYAALAVGAGACVVGISALVAGLRMRDAMLLRLGRRCVFVVLGAAIAAAGVMEWALISHDFSIRYVAENNARGTPFLFTVTGLWASLAGSILLWAVILGGYLAFVA